MRRKREKVLIVILAVIIIWIYACIKMNTIYSSHKYVISKYYRFTGLEIDQIVQEFTPEYGFLEAIDLFIANISDNTDGNICLEIVDETGNQIFKDEYKAASIATGEFVRYKINKKIKAGEKYRICVSYDGNCDEQPQIMISEREWNLPETENMYVGGIESEFNLAINYYYREMV